MDQALWLEARRKGVGGSDIAAIMSLSPWKSQYQCYLEKRGEHPGTEETDIMNWGKRMEPTLRQWYSDKTGRSVRLPDKIMYHKDYPFLLANLDGFTDDERVVELKTARYSRGWGEPGSNEIPDAYNLQTQHYMLVTGFPVADVVVSIGGTPPELYIVPADPELQQMIIEAATEFWRRVQEGDPPAPVTYSDAVQRFGLSTVEGVVLAPGEAIESINHLRAVREQIKELEASEEAIKAELIILMGEKGDCLADAIGQVLVTYKISKGRRSFDAKAFEKDQPDVYAKYVRIGVPTRKFLLK